MFVVVFFIFCLIKLGLGIYFLATIWSDSVMIAFLTDQIQIEVESQQINVASRRDHKHDWLLRSVRLSQFDGLTCSRIISNNH